MVVALLTILGRQYRLRLVLEEVRPSLPPPTFDTVAEPVAGPGLAKALPDNVRVLRPARSA